MLYTYMYMYIPVSDCEREGDCRRGGRERDAGVDGRRGAGGVLTGEDKVEEELGLGATSLSSLILFFASSLTYISLS